MRPLLVNDCEDEVICWENKEKNSSENMEDAHNVFDKMSIV